MARLLVHMVMVKHTGYMGAIISRNMATSLRMSAKSLHCLALQSSLLPFHQAKMMRPNMPVESEERGTGENKEEPRGKWKGALDLGSR